MFFSQNRFRKLSDQVELLGEQSTISASETRQALEAHAKSIEERISAVQEAENNHDMVIEDMLDSWQELQQTLNGAVERLNDSLSKEHDRLLEEARRRENRLLNLAIACGDQLRALRRAAPEGPWQRQLALSEAQFAENALGSGLQVIGREGEAFSPSLHEVLEVDETSDPDQSLRVSEVYTCGYIYSGRVIRKASVKVWQKKQTTEAGK